MDQTLVTSGFDIELLIGNRYLKYILLSLTETGSFPLKLTAGGSIVDIFHPTDVDRTYEPHPDAVPLTHSDHSFESELIWGWGVQFDANIKTDVEVLVDDQFLSIFSNLTLVFDTDSQGRPNNYRIRMAVREVSVTTGLQQALTVAGVTLDEVLAEVKLRADRDVPLPFTGVGSEVKRIVLRQKPSLDGGPIALAFYLNLRLRNGPEKDSLLPPRGDESGGINFLEDGQDIAFAVRDGFLEDMATHQTMQFAEQKTDGSGEYFFPLRQAMFDLQSEQIGTLSSITIHPVRVNNVLTGALSIVIRGEYFSTVFDPDFTFTLTLTPRFDNGVVTWDQETDLSVPSFAVLSFLLLSFLGIPVYLIGTELEDDVDDGQRKLIGRFLESLPVRVPIETIRWDPFYDTVHQIVTRVDHWTVNDQGVAFSGRAALAKETRLVNHIVLRTESRSTEFEVERLDFRVRDYASHVANVDPSRIFSATDRLEYARSGNDSMLFGLTAAQVAERRSLGKILAPQELVPKKVHLDDHKIIRMLCVTPTEVREQIQSVDDRFKRQTRLEIIAAQEDDLRQAAREELETELGVPPTPEQAEIRYREKLGVLVDEAFKAYKTGPDYNDDIESAVDSILSLDMSPNEFGLLQRQGIVNVLGFDLIERRNRKFRPGTVTLYYRDRADFDIRDNLLNKLKYALDHSEL